MSNIILSQYYNNALGIANDTLDPTGFVDNPNIGIAYDSTTRKVTLTHSNGKVYYYWRGIKKYLVSGWESSAHTDTAGAWFLYSTDGINFTWSQTPWEFDKIMVAYVTDGKLFGLREPHGTIPWQLHQSNHLNLGTYRVSGFGLTSGSYVLQEATPTNAGYLFGLEGGVIADEDLPTTLAASLEGTYTTLHFTLAGTVNLTTDASNFIRVTGTYPNINQWSGTAFSEVETATNNYLNYYVIRFPVTSDAASQKYRAVILQPQVAYNSLANAQAENFGNLYLGDLTNLAPEFVFVERVTLRTNASYGTTGKVRIEAVSIIDATRESVSNTTINFNPILRIATATSLTLSFTNTDYWNVNISATEALVISNVPVGRMVYVRINNTHSTNNIDVAIPTSIGDPSPAVVPALKSIEVSIFNNGTDNRIIYTGALD